MNESELTKIKELIMHLLIHRYVNFVVNVIYSCWRFVYTNDYRFMLCPYSYYEYRDISDNFAVCILLLSLFWRWQFYATCNCPIIHI